MAEKNDIDLERCITDSVKQCTGSQASSTSEATQHCPIAVQYSAGKAVLISVTVKEEVHGHLVLNSAWDQLSQALAESWYQRLAGRLLMNIIVGTAKVRQVVHLESQPSPSSSHESSPPPPRLFIQDFIPDPLLTEALHNPNLLFRPGDALRYLHLPIPQQPINTHPPAHQPSQPSLTNNNAPTRNPTNTDNQSIIVIKRVLDKTKIASLLTSLLLLSPTLGLVIGLCSHDAEVGIAISAGVFALASFAQGLVAWVQG